MKPYVYKAQYYETDQMGVIHHSNYIRWMESARIDFLEQLGIHYQDMEAQGVVSPVVEVSAKYRSMVHFGDTVEIFVEVEKYNGVKLAFSYRIVDKDSGELRFTGTSSHCFISREGNILSLKRDFPEIHKKIAEK